MKFVIAACLLALLILDNRVFATDSPGRQENAPPVSDEKILVMVRMSPPHFRPDVSYGDGYRGRAAREARRRIAGDIARAHGLQIETDWPMPELGVECYVMQVPRGASAETVVGKISQDSRAAWAQPMQTFRALDYNDPLFSLQPTAGRWHLEALHTASTGRGVIIAVIDSGVDTAQPDLNGQVSAVANFVQEPYVGEDHGTAVAGIVVARANNRAGIVGIAPEAKLLALRGCWTVSPRRTECNTFSLARALQSAIARQAHVVNLSLGGPQDRLLKELIDVALARGIVIVAATDARDAPSFPASHPGVVSVAAEGSRAMARFAAPGTDVPTTLTGGRWGFVTGSSFAAAEVAGLVALVLQHRPLAGPHEIERLLGSERQVVDVDGRLTTGAIDACRVIARVAPTCVCDCVGAIAADLPAHR
jgi:subtilisin family serine protease